MSRLVRRKSVAVEIGLLALFSPLGLGAQHRDPLPPGIRMVAAYDPTTDVRTFASIEPMSGTEILAIQTALANAGTDPGPLDGQLGPGTRRALERFQRQRGLDVCGCVSYETVIALGLRPLVVQTVIGTAPEAHGVEVFLPKGPPPAPRAGPEQSGTPAGQETPAGQGVDPGQVPSYVEREIGWWVPVYPFHSPVLEPLRGTGRRGPPGDRGPGDRGDRGGILLGPGAGQTGVPGGPTGAIRVIRPPSRGAPRPGPPPRPRPPK